MQYPHSPPCVAHGPRATDPLICLLLLPTQRAPASRFYCHRLSGLPHLAGFAGAPASPSRAVLYVAEAVRVKKELRSVKSCESQQGSDSHNEEAEGGGVARVAKISTWPYRPKSAMASPTKDPVLHDLPLEVLTHVCQHLGLVDLVRVAQSCKRFRHAGLKRRSC
jgi:hypothetical protein